MTCARPGNLDVLDLKETLRMVEAENAKLRYALQGRTKMMLHEEVAHYNEIIRDLNDQLTRAHRDKMDLLCRIDTLKYDNARLQNEVEMLTLDLAHRAGS